MARAPSTPMPQSMRLQMQTEEKQRGNGHGARGGQEKQNSKRGELTNNCACMRCDCQQLALAAVMVTVARNWPQLCGTVKQTSTRNYWVCLRCNSMQHSLQRVQRSVDLPRICNRRCSFCANLVPAKAVHTNMKYNRGNRGMGGGEAVQADNTARRKNKNEEGQVHNRHEEGTKSTAHVPKNKKKQKKKKKKKKNNTRQQDATLRHHRPSQALPHNQLTHIQIKTALTPAASVCCCSSAPLQSLPLLLCQTCCRQD